MHQQTITQYLYLLPHNRRTTCFVHLYSSLLLILLSRTCVVSLSVHVARNDSIWDGGPPTAAPDFDFRRPDNASIFFNETNILPTIANPDYLEEIYADNLGMPMECRNDICMPESTEDYKGRFQWNYTLAGEYAFVPCPFGGWMDYHDGPVFAFRACNPPRQKKLLRNNRLSEDARWDEQDTQICRFTSNITNEIQEIREQILEAIKDMIDKKIANLTEIVLPLTRINQLLSDPSLITPPDVELSASILDVVIAAGQDNTIQLTVDVGTEIVDMADNLLDVDITTLEMAGSACSSVAKNLQTFIGYADLRGADVYVKFNTRNVLLEIQQETTSVFEGPFDFIFKSPSKEGESDGDEHNTVAHIHVPRLQDFVPSMRRDDKLNNTVDDVLNSTAGPTEQDSQSQNEKQNRSINAVPVSKIRMGAIVYISNKFFQIPSVSLSVPSSDDALIYTQVYKDGELAKTDNAQLYITYYHFNPRKTADNETTWFEDNCAGGRLSRNDSLNWRSPYRAVELDWYPESCTLNYTNENYTTCLCFGLELFSIISDLLPTQSPTTPVMPPDPLEFFSFPYSLTLSILSYVGYAISLVSLVLTILTYALFPRLRRGRQTYILLNMCVTLLCYVIFLLSSIAFCDTTVGCRVANVIRVYLILVSLMWNGVEGVHMYLTLVKVFWDYTSYFVFKCGAVAWGLPALIIIIPVLIDISIFDGSIVNCSFACQLSNAAFFYVFLLPMLTIVIFNSVIFGFVIKIVYKVHVNDKTKNMVQRIRGAIAVLVLLGLTWSFSALAAVNYHYYFEVPEAASYVLQTFFVLGIAFQGFFIFMFHCFRYEDVRKQWRKILSPKTPFCQKWRDRKTIRRKSAWSVDPLMTGESPQLTREDGLNTSPPSINDDLPLQTLQENDESERFGIVSPLAPQDDDESEGSGINSSLDSQDDEDELDRIVVNSSLASQENSESETFEVTLKVVRHNSRTEDTHL